MPQPSTTLAIPRMDLGQSLEEFDLAMNRSKFVANRLLPVFEAEKQSSTFGKITLESLLQNRDTKRAPNGGYNRGKYTFTEDSYACKENGAEEPVDDREAEMYSNYFDAEMFAAARAYSAVLDAQEIRVAAKLFNESEATAQSRYLDTPIAWTDAAGAVPVDNVNAAIDSIYGRTGLFANVMVVNKFNLRLLKNSAQVLDRIESAGAGSSSKQRDITLDMLAAVFDLDEIIVAEGTMNIANPAKPATPVQIWGNDYALVARVCRTNDIREPGVGRIFHWGADGSQIGGVIEEYREESTRANIIRCRHDTDEKYLYLECAQLLKVR